MIDNLDKSFLRLKTSFADAKFELLRDSEFVYKENIVLNPTKIYTQISNSLTSIAFDDSYVVSLVNCSDNVVLDITDKIYINEFQDHNGIYQIAFEISPIGVDFYGEYLFLRFEHTGSDLKVWSNPILVSETYKTFRLEYKNYEYYQGISYELANLYQSIDLVGYIDIPQTKETVKIYTQLNGNIRQSRPTQAVEYVYNIDFIDSFTFTRLSTALNSELIYIDGIRFIKSENVQSDGREGKSNYFPTSFTGQFNEIDTLDLGYQIAPEFSIVNLYPLGVYNLVTSSFGIATSDFNMDILTSTYFGLYNYDTEAFIQLIPYNLVDNSVELDFTAISLGIGNYYISTTLTSVLGQVLDLTDKDIWKFSIENGHYNNTQYNNSQYFTD